MKTIYEVDNRIRKKVSEFLEEPVVIRVTDFDEKSAENFANDMSDAHNTGQSIIPIVVDSYGGQVYSLLSMIAEIQAARLPVATIGVGKSMSCGSILLSCGDEGLRFMAPTAHLMLHDLSGMKYGKIEEIKAGAKQSDRLQNQIFGIMAKNCGHEKSYFRDLIHDASHAELYLSPTMAKKHNIIQHIGMPHMKVNVTVDVALETA